MSDGPTEFLYRPVDELAALIRSGDLDSRDLVAASLAQIEARRDLNAFTSVDAASALAAAEAIHPGDPRPFAGVPIAIKDLSAAAGLPQERGSRLFAGRRATYDNHATRRLREAGFIIVGKTASPEFGLVPVTEPRANGPTRNPWDTSRTPGGSSGGAGAAVAGGLVPIAHGSDGGGSIRIPAACCGLVGLKPSRGRISAGPESGDSFLATQGVLARTARESAQLLDILAGYEPGDATWAAPPSEPFATTASRPPRPLRIAMTTEAPFGAAVDPACARAVHDAAALLANLGHTVIEANPPEWQSDQLLDAFMALWYTGPLASVRLGSDLAGRDPHPDELEPLTWSFYERGQKLSAADYLAAIGWLQGYTRRVIPFFADYDLLLIPSLAQRPLPIGYLDTCGDDLAAEFAKALAFTPFTLMWNATGQPAISVPLYHGDDGLPLGIQLVGPPLGDGLLLAVAAQLEQARPWAARRPIGTA